MVDSIFVFYYLPRDPIFEYLRNRYKKLIAPSLIEYMSIDMWVNVAHITHMPLDKFNELNEFEQYAVFTAVNQFISDKNKEQQKVINEIKGSQDSAPYVSPMSSLPRPSFQLP